MHTRADLFAVILLNPSIGLSLELELLSLDKPGIANQAKARATAENGKAYKMKSIRHPHRPDAYPMNGDPTIATAHIPAKNRPIIPVLFS